MELTRGEIILILGLTALAFRIVPQLYFAGQKFPETWDRLLRYLSYALLCGIISTTLFMKGPSFESDSAPYRAAALIATIVVARWTRSALRGLIVGTILVSVFSWLR
jgi:branched-subunit amino acid transport protein